MSSFRDQLLNRAYNRVYTPGLVLGVNSYNRHNSEIDRGTLYDYSGNHRDIKLYDFDYKGMSGYEGFSEDFTDTKYSSITSSSTRLETKVTSALSLNEAWIFGVNSVQYLLQPCWLKISGIDKSKISEDNHLVFYYVDPDNNASRKQSNIYEDGIYRYPGSLSLLDYEGEPLQNAGLYFSGTYTSEQPIVVELLPEYPGGLISNGLNEYGECLQNFTLPTDYTILAIRKIIEPSSAGLSSKGGTQSPFIFEAGELAEHCSAWSYGSSTTVDRNTEDLFTYQTKESYNGQLITAGSIQDSEANKLYIFKQDADSGTTIKAVLWDLRIYDHSLTSEELELVKDEMISNYQYATGSDYFRPKPLIHWDFSKYSNEDHPENIPDLTGNGYDAAMTNFDFKSLSGYGGYAYDFSDYGNSSSGNAWRTFMPNKDWVVPSSDGSKFTISHLTDTGTVLYQQPQGEHTGIDITFKVTGLDANSRFLKIYSFPSNNCSRDIVKDGVYRYKITPAEMAEDDAYIIFYIAGPASGIDLQYPIVIEQLPLYPGSLVFDNSYINTIKAAYFPNRSGFTFIGKRRLLDKNIRNALFGKYLGTEGNARIIGDYINNNNNNIYSYGGYKSIGILEDGILKFNSSTIGVGEYTDINKGTLEDNPNSPLSIGTYQKPTVDAVLNQGEGKFAVSEAYVFDRDLSKYQMDQFVSENMIPDPVVYYDIRKQDCRNGTNIDNSLRDTLIDFSGNGNHGTLNGFSYTADSGWGTSYVDDEQELSLSSDAGDSTFENHILTIQNPVGWVIMSPSARHPRYVKDFRIKISGLTQGMVRLFKVSKGITTYLPFAEDGIYEIPGYRVEGYSNRSLGIVSFGANNGVTVEFLPQTDYLQFALNNYVSFPDSLGSMKTVIAVANVSVDGSVIYDSAQSDGNNRGIVHKADTVAYEYRNSGKNYINGIENKDVVCSSLLNKSVIATIVNGEDTSTLKYLGRSIDGSSSAIMKLYKFLGFSEALTESQIKRVIEKYSLMSGVDDIDVSGNFLNEIHYVADWDAKGRSNDEEGGISKWIDKVNGKVINLNNFAYAGMSGWNGYQFNWSAWRSDIADNGGTVIRTQTSIRMTNTGTRPSWTIAYVSGLDSINSFRIRVSGLKPGKKLYFSGATRLSTITKDGIYTIPADASAPPNYSFQPSGYSENENTDLLIEQLPLYPGALVSDGIDDYGVTAEVISEEVGTVVVLAKYLDEDVNNNKMILNCKLNDHPSRIVIWNYASNLNIGRPNKILGKTATMFDLTRTPASPEARLVLFNSEVGGVNQCKCAIQRIIFIEEQLSEFQVNYLKEKVIREYKDWCIANGYDPSSITE